METKDIKKERNEGERKNVSSKRKERKKKERA